MPFSAKYPQGVKYGLICVDEQSGRRVLFDNHHPKGPHVHLNEQEMAYVFTTEEKLVADFKQLVLERMGIKL